MRARKAREDEYVPVLPTFPGTAAHNPTDLVAAQNAIDDAIGEILSVERSVLGGNALPPMENRDLTIEDPTDPLEGEILYEDGYPVLQTSRLRVRPRAPEPVPEIPGPFVEGELGPQDGSPHEDLEVYPPKYTRKLIDDALEEPYWKQVLVTLTVFFSLLAYPVRTGTALVTFVFCIAPGDFPTHLYKFLVWLLHPDNILWRLLRGWEMFCFGVEIAVKSLCMAVKLSAMHIGFVGSFAVLFWILFVLDQFKEELGLIDLREYVRSRAQQP